MKILVLGYFGFETNQIDGQTIKTRDIHTLIKEKSTESVEYFDTQSFKQSKLNVFRLLKKLIKADVVFYLPAHNNLKYIFPFLYVISKLARIKLNYLVVGGWLYEFLKNKPFHRLMLARVDGIYAETENINYNLKSYGFSNVSKLHNFRAIKYPELGKKINTDGVIKMVFMARVHPLKGIDLLFELECQLKALGIKNFVIDIYGPILTSYKAQFFEQLEKSDINYCGIVDPTKVYGILQNYDLMLFPTKYYTEGFPGTILDAYISGVPTLSTNWLNAAEFIEDGKTGFIVDFDNEQEFIDKAISLVYDPEKIYNLNKYVVVKREQFSQSKAWDILKTAIYAT